MKDTTQFAYAVGRIRVLDCKLLNNDEVERMLGAKSARDAYRILNETNYADHVGDIENIESFQKVLDAGLLDTKEILEKIRPDTDVLNILWYQYDIHNIKTLLKAKLTKKDLEDVKDHLMSLGVVPVDMWIDVIWKDEIRELPMPEEDSEEIQKAIRQATELYEKNGHLQSIDLFLDKTYFRLALKIAQKSTNEFLNEFVRKNIDIANIMSFLRIKLENRGKELLNEVLIDGGTIAVSKFEDAFSEGVKNFVDIMKNTNYGKEIQEGVENYESEKSFLIIEKLLDNLRINFIKQAKLIAFGPEPLIGHFWAKANNAIVIRTIMIGKLSDVPDNIIREKLRILY